MPWWQSNPDEYFLGVKKRQPYPMPQQQQRLPQRLPPRQIIIKQVNAPRMSQRQNTRVSVRQKTIIKPIFKRMREGIASGLGSIETATESKAKQIEERGKQIGERYESSKGLYKPKGILGKIKYVFGKD